MRSWLAVGAAVALATAPAGSPTAASGAEQAAPATTPATPADTLSRVPGCALRLGWTRERTSALGTFRVTGGDAHSETREGEIRWFGSEARAILTFREGHLAEARLTDPTPSPRMNDYVPDELRRLGYRVRSATLSGKVRTAVYDGPCHIRLTSGGGVLSAVVTAAPPPAPRPASPSTMPASPTATMPGAAPSAVHAGSADSTATDPFAILLGTADDFSDASDGVGAPARTFTPEPPTRPEIARTANVFGRVLVRALVGVDGRVEAARIERAIPELNSAAIEWASGVTFQPYRRDGVARPFLITIPVAFLPERARRNLDR